MKISTPIHSFLALFHGAHHHRKSHAVLLTAVLIGACLSMEAQTFNSRFEFPATLPTAPGVGVDMFNPAAVESGSNGHRYVIHNERITSGSYTEGVFISRFDNNDNFMWNNYVWLGQPSLFTSITFNTAQTYLFVAGVYVENGQQKIAVVKLDPQEAQPVASNGFYSPTGGNLTNVRILPMANDELYICATLENFGNTPGREIAILKIDEGLALEQGWRLYDTGVAQNPTTTSSDNTSFADFYVLNNELVILGRQGGVKLFGFTPSTQTLRNTGMVPFHQHPGGLEGPPFFQRETSSDNIYIGGYVFSGQNPAPNPPSDLCGWIMKLDANFSQLWAREYYDDQNLLTVLPSGGFKLHQNHALMGTDMTNPSLISPASRGILHFNTANGAGNYIRLYDHVGNTGFSQTGTAALTALPSTTYIYGGDAPFDPHKRLLDIGSNGQSVTNQCPDQLFSINTLPVTVPTTFPIYERIAFGTESPINAFWGHAPIEHLNCVGTPIPRLAQDGNEMPEAESPSLSGITLSPNPTSGLLRLEVSEEGFSSYTILDTQGKVLVGFDGRPLQPGQNQLDLTGVAKGIYFLKLTGDSGTQTERIVVK